MRNIFQLFVAVCYFSALQPIAIVLAVLLRQETVSSPQLSILGKISAFKVSEKIFQLFLNFCQFSSPQFILTFSFPRRIENLSLDSQPYVRYRGRFPEVFNFLFNLCNLETNPSIFSSSFTLNCDLIQVFRKTFQLFLNFRSSRRIHHNSMHI